VSNIRNWIDHWRAISPGYLPFADAATEALPIGRMIRLSLFQVSAGMAIVLLSGTLNRVMVVELQLPTSLVALLIAVPLLIAPFRALIGHRSDHHRSLLGWRRVPYIWMGTLLQFGGLAIMPFALLVLSTPDIEPAWLGQAGAGLAFILVGIGLHTTQTAGLALATDLAPEEVRPRVVSLLYVMLLLGMILSSVCFSVLLADFNDIKLIQVIQGTAVVTMVLNIAALWKQEARNPSLTSDHTPRPRFADAWSEFSRNNQAVRLLVAIGLGTAAFSMQDVLLEPYGGQILKLSVSATTGLTAIFVTGMLIALAFSSRRLSDGADPVRVAGMGIVIGICGFATVIFAGAAESSMTFRLGVLMVGVGGGFFAVGTLTAMMAIAETTQSGLALGAWGAVQATSAGIGIALGGVIRDSVTGLINSGSESVALDALLSGYSAVYTLEILLLFATLIAIGPLARYNLNLARRRPEGFGLPNFPGQ
jgi:BCD family chlorophyll transporter-like MFS transporter